MHLFLSQLIKWRFGKRTIRFGKFIENYWCKCSDLLIALYFIERILNWFYLFLKCPYSFWIWIWFHTVWNWSHIVWKLCVNGVESNLRLGPYLVNRQMWWGKMMMLKNVFGWGVFAKTRRPKSSYGLFSLFTIVSNKHNMIRLVLARLKSISF